MKRSARWAASAVCAAVATPVAALFAETAAANEWAIGIEDAADRGTGGTVTAFTSWTCQSTGPSHYTFQDLWQVIGGTTGPTGEWVELGIEHCTFGSGVSDRRWVYADCRIPVGGSNCTYAEQTLFNAVPAPGGTATVKHINTVVDPSYRTWETYLNGGFVVSVKDFTPPASVLWNQSEAGLEIWNNFWGTTSNGAWTDLNYRDFNGAWHDWNNNSCLAYKPPDASWLFGAHDAIIYNLNGGAGAC